MAITYPEAHQLPQLTVYVHDGTGTAVAVWMGRSELPGVRVGDRIHLEATVSVRSGQPVLLNPYYRLLESK
ncbi:MAG: hypothetical protein Q4P06_01645 [Actinomycetaceae bacterium]|nr:hypothetical protein [Actinomycetaceae bacterium]